MSRGQLGCGALAIVVREHSAHDCFCGVNDALPMIMMPKNEHAESLSV
jgi:hypothetical protein